jgi:hypothetical protein
LIAVAIVILAFSVVIAGYTYAPSPVQSGLSITAEDHEAPLPPETGLMILCPDKAREMGLCNPDERNLHAKYRLTVEALPPPEARVTIECRVTELIWLAELRNAPPVRSFPYERLMGIPGDDRTGSFTCTYTRTSEGAFEVDLAFVGDADNEQLIGEYWLSLKIAYDGHPLSFELVTVNPPGDLCVLGYDSIKLQQFRCDEAVFQQRDVLGIGLRALQSGWSKMSPTIDGSMQVAEWSDATRLKLGETDLYVKNDNDFLYAAVNSTARLAPSSSISRREFTVWLYFDVDHDSEFREGRDVAYVYFWPSGLNGFVRYSNTCEFIKFQPSFILQKYEPQFLIEEIEAFLRSSACLEPLKRPGSIVGSFNDLRITVEMKTPLQGEDAISTNAGQIVGLSAVVAESVESDGQRESAVELAMGFIYVALAQGNSPLEAQKREQQQFNYVASVAGISAAIAVVVAIYVIRKRSRKPPEGTNDGLILRVRYAF